MNYVRGSARFSAFTNIVNAEAPNLLVPNPLTESTTAIGFQDADLRSRERATRC